MRNSRNTNESKTMTDAEAKRQQGTEDIQAIQDDLDRGKLLSVILRSMSSVRVGIVTTMLTKEYPRTKAKCVAILKTHYAA